jgi:predicted TIM-barrel fold metal-dependent hydrolase
VSVRYAFSVVDVDSHVYEPESLWSDYVPADSREVVTRAFWRRGEEITVNGAPAKPLGHSKINRSAIWRPGMTVEDIGRLDLTNKHADNPGASDAVARLADLEALGIDHQIIFPTLFGEYFPVVEDSEAAVVLAQAYNDWAADFAAAGQGHLHPAAVLPMQDISGAIEELNRVAEAGFCSVVLRPMFHRMPPVRDSSADGESVSGNPNGLYIDHAEFRPLWARIEELGVVACVHPFLGIANREGTSEGSFVERVSEKLSIGHSVAEPVAYMEDGAIFVVVAAFHGLLEDYPALKLALLHSGASMVPLAIEKAETYLWLSLSPTNNPVSLEPEEVFAGANTLYGFDGWESSVVRLGDFFANKGAWGSRYPNHDASSPQDAIDLCERYHISDQVTARLLGINAAELFGFSVVGT